VNDLSGNAFTREGGRKGVGGKRDLLSVKAVMNAFFISLTLRLSY
jgi:hypothetical protein